MSRKASADSTNGFGDIIGVALLAAVGHRGDAIYAEFLGSHRPARTVAPVAGLHYGYLVEMDVIAAVRE